MFVPFWYFNITSSQLGRGLSETGQHFVGVLAWEALLMGWKRPPTGAGMQKAHGPAKSAAVSFRAFNPFPKWHERWGQDWGQPELVAQVPGAAGFKPGVTRHQEVTNSDFHQPFLESKAKAKGTWRFPSPPLPPLQFSQPPSSFP